MRNLSALSLVFLAACGSGGSKKPLASATIDTLPGGVVRVTNTGPTAWPDTSGWRLVEERVILPEEGSPGEIGNPGGVTASADGSVFLMQSDPVGIKVYGPDGKWVRTIGRDGDGPGEFRNGMFTLVGDVLVVQDPNNTRMTTFRTNGEFIGTAVTQCCWWSSQFPVFEDGTIGILGPPPPSHSDRQGAMWVTRMDGTITDTILLPPRASRENTPGMWTITRKTGTSSSMMGVSVPLYPSDAAAYLPARKKIAGNTGSYTLAIMGLHGDTLRLFSAPAPSLTISDTQRDSIYEATIERMSESWREAMRAVTKKSDIPLTWPAWSDITVDAASRIWVARPGAKGSISILDVFTPDGVLLGSVPAPAKEIMNAWWTADHVYLQDEADDGLPRIRVFRIEKHEDK